MGLTKAQYNVFTVLFLSIKQKKKLTININTNSDVQNLGEDPYEQLWSTNQNKRLSFPELSPKSKEQKIPKTNTMYETLVIYFVCIKLKTMWFITPKCYEALEETDIPNSIEITEQTNEISSLTPPPIFINTLVDFNDFCKSILTTHHG